jgi:hypothetical protein
MDATLHGGDGFDQSAAAAVLAAGAEALPRRIDWRSRSAAIHALLDATSPSILPAIAKTLVATGVDSTNAGEFLRGGGMMLTAMVGSIAPQIRDPAHALLVRLAGQDLGFDVVAWRKWIASL